MENQISDSLKGQFLMAMPGLTDPNFLPNSHLYL